MDTISQLVQDYREHNADYEELRNNLGRELDLLIRRYNIPFSPIRVRVKTPERVEEKLRKKARRSLFDLTDLVAARVVTYYAEDVDRVASVVRTSFVCDWPNCEDKRDLLRAEAFGYKSDHYVIKLPDSMVAKQLQGIRVEVQVRSILQDAWAEIEHDELGYTASSMVPREARRRLARAAALLESVEEEFRELRILKERLSSVVPPKLRWEGFTEALPEMELSIPAPPLLALQRERQFGHEAPVVGDLCFFFNANVTTSPDTEQDALLVLEDAVRSRSIRGVSASANQICFPGALPAHISDGQNHLRARLRGLRFNANQLAPGHSISVFIAAIWADCCAALATSIVAGTKPALYIQPPLVKPISELSNSHNIELSEMVPQQLMSEVRSGRYLYCDLLISEAFPGAFRDSFMETGRDRVLKSGTRFLLTFPEVPSDVELLVESAIFDLEGSLIGQLIRTDTNGCGPFNPTHEPFVRVDPQAGYPVVWEFVKCSDRPTARTFRLRLIPIPQKERVSGRLTAVATLAPLSSFGTPIGSYYIPRFNSVYRPFVIFDESSAPRRPMED